MRIGIINGPNLNLTGEREKNIYGDQSFDDLLSLMKLKFPDTKIDYFQTNLEGEIIDKIHELNKSGCGIILNAGGYTHTSVSIADAVAACKVPVIEVHLSNIFQREKFRHVSLLGAHAKGIIAGFGFDSYILAMEQLVRLNG
jgi:3-dehydroquinate dehydratase-2